MKDSLGDRMKGNYENRFRYYLPRRGYTIIRIDGKAFHSYTRGLEKPYCHSLMRTMDLTAKHLIEEIQGAKLSYVQSDEISVLLTDFDTLDTQAWFDNNLSKLLSVSASLATYLFNTFAAESMPESHRGKMALFDSRAFQLPDEVETMNYFIWRQQDATRNAIQMAAQCYYSDKELHGKNTNEQQEMLFQKGVNFNDYLVRYKRGGLFYRDESVEGNIAEAGEELPIFTQDKEYLKTRIPLKYQHTSS